jgi:hypothetical protein
MMLASKELEVDGDFNQTYIGSYGILRSKGKNSKRPERVRIYITLLTSKKITIEVWYNLFQSMNGNETILIIPFNKNNPTRTRVEYVEKAVILKRKFKRNRVHIYYTIDIQFRNVMRYRNWILRLTVPSKRDFSAGNLILRTRLSLLLPVVFNFSLQRHILKHVYVLPLGEKPSFTPKYVIIVNNPFKVSELL